MCNFKNFHVVFLYFLDEGRNNMKDGEVTVFIVYVIVKTIKGIIDNFEIMLIYVCNVVDQNLDCI